MSRHIKIATDGSLIEEATMTEASHSVSFPDNDPVNKPSHYQSYTNNGIECIDAMTAAFGKECVASFCKANAFKYIWRCSSKGGNQDIQKAIWYLNKFLEVGGCE